MARAGPFAASLRSYALRSWAFSRMGSPGVGAPGQHSRVIPSTGKSVPSASLRPQSAGGLRSTLAKRSARSTVWGPNTPSRARPVPRGIDEPAPKVPRAEDSVGEAGEDSRLIRTRRIEVQGGVRQPAGMSVSVVPRSVFCPDAVGSLRTKTEGPTVSPTSGGGGDSGAGTSSKSHFAVLPYLPSVDRSRTC